MSVTITAFISDANTKIKNKTAARSIDNSEHGQLLIDLAEILQTYFGDADTSLQPYLRLNYAGNGDTRLYSVNNLASLQSIGNGLAAYEGGNVNLASITGKHILARGGHVQVQGVSSDAKVIVNSGSGYQPYIQFAENGTSKGTIGYQAGGNVMLIRAQSSTMSDGNLAVAVHQNGRVTFGGITDDGYLVNFNGQTLFKNHLNLTSNAIIYCGTTNTYITGNGSGELFIHGHNQLRFSDYIGTSFIAIAPPYNNTTAAIARALNVGDGNEANACAILEARSTNKGFLLPRMTTAQRNNITSPLAGLVIYNTTTGKSETYDGTTWNAHY